MDFGEEIDRSKISYGWDFSFWECAPEPGRLRQHFTGSARTKDRVRWFAVKDMPKPMATVRALQRADRALEDEEVLVSKLCSVRRGTREFRDANFIAESALWHQARVWVADDDRMEVVVFCRWLIDSTDPRRIRCLARPSDKVLWERLQRGEITRADLDRMGDETAARLCRERGWE